MLNPKSFVRLKSKHIEKAATSFIIWIVFSLPLSVILCVFYEFQSQRRRGQSKYLTENEITISISGLSEPGNVSRSCEIILIFSVNPVFGFNFKSFALKEEEKRKPKRKTFTSIDTFMPCSWIAQRNRLYKTDIGKVAAERNWKLHCICMHSIYFDGKIGVKIDYSLICFT